MVVVTRLRQAKKLLQQAVDGGGVEQILATDDIAHPLQRVVDDDRKVVAGRRVLARENDITPGLRPRQDLTSLTVRALPLLDPCERTGPRVSRGHIQPQGVSGARQDQPIAFALWREPGRTRVKRCPVGVARPWPCGLALRDPPRDPGAAFGRGVDQAQRRQPLERGTRVRQMV